MRNGSRFLKACRMEKTDCTPVWFMRQAGRYMAEYRKIRKRHTLLEICEIPDLAAEVTLQPVRALGVDAAILFADILLPLRPMGASLEFTKGEGPVIAEPVRGGEQIERLRVISAEEDLSYVLQAIRIVRKELPAEVPLIGFAGAPFTLAAYLIEGGGSKQYLTTKTFMYNETRSWHILLDKLATVIGKYLKAQQKAGAQALQLFDSWVGMLSPGDYEEYVLPHTKKVFSLVREGVPGETRVPTIHFGTETSSLLELMKEAGGDVIGVDWRINLDEAWSRLGNEVAIQGNLDPAALLGPLPEVEKKVREILRRAGNRPGHIFNLGHGVFPQTPVEHVRATVEMVHALSAGR